MWLEGPGTPPSEELFRKSPENTVIALLPSELHLHKASVMGTDENVLRKCRSCNNRDLAYQESSSLVTCMCSLFEKEKSKTVSLLMIFYILLER